MPDHLTIAKELSKRSRKIWRAPRQCPSWTLNEEANALIDDIEDQPEAFLIGVVVDRQIKAERAWWIPYAIKMHFKTLDPVELSKVSVKRFQGFLRRKQLHRYPEQMGKNIAEAIKRIVTVYDGDASNIWSDNPSSALVTYRFLQFRGIGPKLASMAANILAREFKVSFADHYSIDISVDVHVRRVFTRLGLVESGASVEEIIFMARHLSPKYPGLLDMGAFQIGRQWCKPSSPLCDQCYLSTYCSHANSLD